jgi:hypothetical protein
MRQIGVGNCAAIGLRMRRKSRRRSRIWKMIRSKIKSKSRICRQAAAESFSVLLSVVVMLFPILIVILLQMSWGDHRLAHAEMASEAVPCCDPERHILLPPQAPFHSGTRKALS